MTFNSLLFVAFFAIVFTVVCLLRNRVVQRNTFLLLAGWFFYGMWDWRFLFLLIGTSTFDYLVARKLDATDHALIKQRKWLVAASVMANLLVLGFFKYFNFFIEQYITLMNLAGFNPHATTLRIILPVGISFYTFQSIAYVIDVYRGHLKAEKNFLHYATFVGFFPQLVAGPIERATHLLPQIKSPNVITWDNICSGFALIGFGMFKKIVLADNLAPIANVVFNSSDSVPTWWESILGIYAFALQIYCDFSAYSDIARGVARMMGFELMRNFDLPYFATNPSDFWRRWHISLSTWLRDYLYIPLGGNRGGLLVKPVAWVEQKLGRPASKTGMHLSNYFNLFVTMLLGGLWHGATWLFVLWGAYHGLLLCVHRLFQPVLKKYFDFKSTWARGLWTFVRIIVFFQFTCFGWLLFRAIDMATMQRILRPFWDFNAPHAKFLLYKPATLSVALAVMAVVLISAQLVKYFARDHEVIFRIPVPVRALIYVGLIVGMIAYGEFGGGDFIYFQF